MKLKSVLLTSLATTGLLALGTTAANADTVIVKAGDTLSAIAQTHKTSVSAIQKANKLKNVNLIYVGDKLEVNGKTTTVTAQLPTSSTATSTASSSATSTASAASSSATSASSQSSAASESTSTATSSSSTASAASSSADSTSTTSQASASSASSESTSSTATSASTTDLTASTASSASMTDTASTTTDSSSTTTTSSTSTTSTTSSSSSEEAAKAWIANKESGGSYTASNGNYYGKYQLTKSLLNGDYSASNQESVANAYVTSRYGSWVAAKTFWEANGYY